MNIENFLKENSTQQNQYFLSGSSNFLNISVQILLENALKSVTNRFKLLKPQKKIRKIEPWITPNQNENTLTNTTTKKR